jgi:hypothetical protein
MTDDNIYIPPQWTALSSDEEIPLPTLVEVNFAILKLKNNRMSGPERLNAKLSKVDEMSIRLWKLTEMIWKRKYFPVSWRKD